MPGGGDASSLANNLPPKNTTFPDSESKANQLVLCGGGLDDGVAEIIGLGVNEGFKRQGIATSLVDAAIEDMAQFFSGKGYSLRVIMLLMERTNETARNFYSVNKFKEVAVVPSLYPHDDASIWTRHL